MDAHDPPESTPPDTHVPLPETLGHDPLRTFNPMRSTVRTQPVEATSSPETMREGSVPIETPQPIEAAGYTVRRVLGVGGLGEVWEALQVRLGRAVALKRPRRDRTIDASQGKRAEIDEALRQEARTGAVLDHPNIVPVYDLGTDADGAPVLAMKLVGGTNWDELLSKDFVRLPVEDFLARHLPILVSVTQAVCFAHERGILHRDLKPGQVMVGEFGEVLLADWGLAILYDPDRLAAAGAHRIEGLSSLDSASNPAGTPSYMAPEQTRPDAAGLGPWTDAYLLGGILYKLLTGAPPHPGDWPPKVFRNAAQGLVPAPELVAPFRPFPPQLADIAMRALERDPADRFPSAREFLRAVEDYIGGASARRDSAAVAASARARLERSDGDYGELSEAVAELVRARLLWPGNPDATALFEEALLAYAKSALHRGDLTLARVQAERLAPGSERECILAAIHAEEARVARERLARRRIRIALAAAVSIIIVGGAAFTWTLDRARKEALEQRDRADRARAEATAERDAARAARERASASRAEAHGLLTYIMLDLGRQLRPIGRLTILDGMYQRVHEHLRRWVAEEVTPQERSTYVRLLGEMAIVRRSLGRLEEAMKLSAERMREAELLLQADPKSAEHRAHLAQASLSLALDLAAIGRIREARKLGEEGMRSGFDLQRETADLNTLREFVSAGSTWLAAWRYVGTEEPAFRHLHAFAALPESYGSRSAEAARIANGGNNIPIALADQLRRREEIAESERLLLIANEVVRVPFEKDSMNFMARISYASVKAELALTLLEAERIAEAESLIVESETLFRDALTADQANLLLRDRHADTAFAHGRVFEALGRHALARERYLKALDGLNVALGRTPTYYPMRWRRHGFVADAIRIHLIQLELPEAEEMIAAGEEGIAADRRSFPEGLTLDAPAAKLLLVKGDVALARGDADAAQAAWTAARDAIQRLRTESLDSHEDRILAGDATLRLARVHSTARNADAARVHLTELDAIVAAENLETTESIRFHHLRHSSRLLEAELALAGGNAALAQSIAAPLASTPNEGSPRRRRERTMIAAEAHAILARAATADFASESMAEWREAARLLQSAEAPSLPPRPALRLRILAGTGRREEAQRFAANLHSRGLREPEFLLVCREIDLGDFPD